MIRQCAWCGRFLGLKKPKGPIICWFFWGSEFLKVSHGICCKCLQEQGVDPGPLE